jgi:Ni,Fe-hydrogenase I cytochrome b subunit
MASAHSRNHWITRLCFTCLISTNYFMLTLIHPTLALVPRSTRSVRAVRAKGRTKKTGIFFHSTLLVRTRASILCSQKGLLRILFAFTTFQHNLWKREFILHTEYSTLTFTHFQKKLNSTLTRCPKTILRYDFMIKYRPGIMSILYVHLSRLFPKFLYQ